MVVVVVATAAVPVCWALKFTGKAHLTWKSYQEETWKSYQGEIWKSYQEETWKSHQEETWKLFQEENWKSYQEETRVIKSQVKVLFAVLRVTHLLEEDLDKIKLNESGRQRVYRFYGSR